MSKNLIFIYDYSHNDFVTIIDLPEGEHQYKFCVDGNWKCDPKVVSLLIHFKITSFYLMTLYFFLVYD